MRGSTQGNEGRRGSDRGRGGGHRGGGGGSRGSGGDRGRGGGSRGSGGDRGGRGGDRGRGGGSRGRGRGGGFIGGDSRMNQTREKDAIMDFANETFDCPLEANTNLFPLDIDNRKKIYIHIVSYEMKGGAGDLQDRLKIKACEEMLKKMKKEINDQGSFDFDICICTGQSILSPQPLPVEEYSFGFEVKGRKGKTTQFYQLTVAKKDCITLDIDKHRTEINSIIGKAVKTCYRDKIGEKYIDINGNGTTVGSRIATFDGVIPKVFATTIRGKKRTILQIDISVTVASTRNCLTVIEELKRSDSRVIDRLIIEKFIKKKVCTIYNASRGSIYTVSGISDKKAKDATGLKGNPEQTYVQYFAERYRMQINPEQTLFECKTSSGRKVFIPPEVLYELSIDEKDRRQLPLLCSIYPDDRRKRVADVLKRLKTEENGAAINILKKYGISFSDKELLVSGYVLGPVEILIPRDQGYKSVQTLGECNQQGFLKELQVLHHPGDRRSLDVVIYDETNRGGTVLNIIKKNLDSINSPVRLENVYHVKNIKDAKGFSYKKMMAFAFFRQNGKENYQSLKSIWTKKDIFSQMIVKDLTEYREASIVKAVSQQVSAKQGKLNWVMDIAKCCPLLTQKMDSNNGLLIIAGDIGRDQVNVRFEKSTMRESIYTVAFVAFFVRGKDWITYCNHYHVNGKKETIFSSGQDAKSSQLSGGVLIPSEVLSEKMENFIQDAQKHFNQMGLKVSALLFLRGCASEGEMINAQQHDVDFLSAYLKDNVAWAAVAAQRYVHTRLSAKTPGNPSLLCNVPRGFVTSEGTDKRFGESFFLNGANCTLGHARSTLYVVFGRKNIFELSELQKLIYGMCFLYPNKTDALPLPLPLKCASEYARKFVPLREVETLPQSLRTTMHYL
ncbi:putative argonaute-like protein [Trypanosoma theileri]|uniref:Putative argonaute-like protein n=1 Tax=Trypanosoma theileri TaxID=67003 RepID=A0A1X0P0P6_9TRYP|nr:putative argonaute-like protein [Trypanosoma theileri]ORC90475.1 putative argonaute-like protein [Trypanosoma theileri]